MNAFRDCKADNLPSTPHGGSRIMFLRPVRVEHVLLQLTEMCKRNLQVVNKYRCSNKCLGFVAGFKFVAGFRDSPQTKTKQKRCLVGSTNVTTLSPVFVY